MRREEERLAQETQRKQKKTSKKSWNAAEEKESFDKLDVFMSKSLVSSNMPIRITLLTDLVRVSPERSWSNSENHWQPEPQRPLPNPNLSQEEQCATINSKD